MQASDMFRHLVQEKLRAGFWRPGDRLPTEREFATDYGISRSTVRRVLAEWKHRKLIRQIVGSGTYVSDDLARLLEGDIARKDAGATSPADLMAARIALEPAIVDLAVVNGTQADFERMRICCSQAEAAHSIEDFEHWDGLLHEVISEATHNEFVLNVFRLMNQARAQERWGELKRRSVTPQRRASYQIQHRRIVGALFNRDAAEARAAMLAHLLEVRRNLLGH